MKKRCRTKFSKKSVQNVCKKENGGWDEELRSEAKDGIENVRMINAHLYKMMFKMYDQVKELKT